MPQMDNHDLVSFYLEGNSMAATGRKFNITPYKVKQTLLRKGVQIRSRKEQAILENMKRGYPLNHNYFDELNYENVYYMGFIAADGNISKTTNRIKIGLSSVDRPFLEEFQRKIKSKRKIIDYITSNGFNVSELSFSSLRIKENLSKHGIIPSKTYTGVTMKNIPEEYKIAFIKGYFDGDGSFSFDKDRHYCRVRICSYQRAILEEINEYFLNEGRITLDKNKHLYEICFATEPALDIMKRFYEIDTPCLIRKKEKYENALSIRIKSPRAKNPLD